MLNSITENVQKLWEHWNIRGTVLFSLLLQNLLIIFAPLRKRTAQSFIILLIWSGYLLADAVANFAVGLISYSQSNVTSSSAKNAVNSDLLAFWAPFLLVHLGGPDTITAYALQDNELWLRHFLILIFQAAATGYVFGQTLPDNKLALPTFLMFFSGIIKYLERTRSLYLASVGNFHDSMLKERPTYSKLVEKYAATKHPLPLAGTKLRNETAKKNPEGTCRENLNNLQVVQKAYGLFKTFRGLIVDLIFSFKKRNDSRDLFDRLSPSTALNVLELELNFIYEVLFTKVVVVHSRWGYFFRLLSVCSVVSALAVFHFHVKKHNFDRFHVGITYTLLYGAIALDAVAFLMAIFSDWTLAAMAAHENRASDQSCWRSIVSMLSKMAESIFAKLLRLREPKWFTPMDEDEAVRYHFMASSIIFRRWSGSIAGHNLITYCLKGHPIRIYRTKKSNKLLVFINKISQCVSNSTKTAIGVLHLKSAIGFLNFLKDNFIDLTGLRDSVVQFTYVSSEPLTEELWELIFNELCKKSEHVDDPVAAQRISSAKGDWVLQNSDLGNIQRLELKGYVDIPYDETLLLWHIATELLYNCDEDKEVFNGEGYKHRHFSKILSDYMMYLLIMQPAIMSAAAGIGKIMFRDICGEARRFFEDRGLRPNQQEEACKNTLGMAAEVEADESKSLLFVAGLLAMDLKKMEANKKWELTSKIWVELLSYAASHCKAAAHAQQVSKGGELITFVWLLMAHFGIGDHFKIGRT